jgi:predicted transcriptional regulator
MSELRQKRIAARIPGRLLCPRARITPGRLSEIERGYVTPRASEVERIWQALDELIAAREKVQRYARSVGWPME